MNKATEAFNEANIPLYTLSNYTALMQVALEQGVVEETDMELLASWKQDPTVWGK